MEENKTSFSIITVSYNSEEFIEDCILSVLNQNYKNYEYIIIDGGSKDKTVDIIKKYEDQFNGRMKWISEPDQGLYDAMNKGIKLSQNEVVGFLNSDDFYVSNNVLGAIAEPFNDNNNLDSCYASLVYVDRDNTNMINKISTFSLKMQFFNKFVLGWHPPHLTFFAKRTLYEEYGGFDLHFDIAADFDLMCRFIAKNDINIQYVPKIIIKMRDGGVSNNKVNSVIKNSIESFNALKKNGVFPYLVFLKPARKFYRVAKAKFYNIIGKDLNNSIS